MTKLIFACLKRGQIIVRIIGKWCPSCFGKEFENRECCDHMPKQGCCSFVCKGNKWECARWCKDD